MKKKLVMLLAACCVVAMLGGCKNDKKNTEDDKKTEESADGAEAEKSFIEYDPADYVTLGEYKGIEISLSSTYEVTDEAVREGVEKMIAAYPEYEDSDKTTIENGDFVNIDFEGLKDGVAFDNGSAQGYVLEIGSNSFIDGFESGLIGVNVGDTVTLNLTFPENYQNNTELAGQEVVFNVTVNKIVNKIDVTYDTMTDEYVASNFSSRGYTTVDELINGYREQLETSNESQKESDIQGTLISKIKEGCTINGMPEGLLDLRVSEYMEQFETQIQSVYGMTLEQYLSATQTTEEDFKNSVVESMTTSVETEMLLKAIGQAEGIEVDEEGFSEYVAGIVADYQYDSEEALLEEYGRNYVEDVYLNMKVLEMLKENAVINYGEAATE